MLQRLSHFSLSAAGGEADVYMMVVTPEEAEAIFFQEPLVVRGDVRHSKKEKRYYALGQTDTGRRLFVAFTIRGDLIRVISVRDMNRNEGRVYARYEEESNS